MPVIKQIEDSSQISRIAHDPATNVLQVTFKQGGKTYEYPNFTADQFDAFAAADSKGKHFGEHLRKKVDAHPHRKLEDHEVWA